MFPPLPSERMVSSPFSLDHNRSRDHSVPITVMDGYSKIIEGLGHRQLPSFVHCREQSHLVPSMNTYIPVRMRDPDLLSMSHYSRAYKYSEQGWRDGSVVDRAALSRGDLALVPSTHIELLTATCGSSSKGFDTLFWPLWVLHSHAQTHGHTHIYIVFKLNVKNSSK